MLFGSLGTLDFLTVMVLLGAAIIPQKLLLIAAIYLLLKGLLFIIISKDLASYGDFASGIYLLVFYFGVKIPYLHQAVLFYLFQKSLLTFLAIGVQLAIFYLEYKEKNTIYG